MYTDRSLKGKIFVMLRMWNKVSDEIDPPPSPPCPHDHHSLGTSQAVANHRAAMGLKASLGTLAFTSRAHCMYCLQCLG